MKETKDDGHYWYKLSRVSDHGIYILIYRGDIHFHQTNYCHHESILVLSMDDILLSCNHHSIYYRLHQEFHYLFKYNTKEESMINFLNFLLIKYPM